MCKVVFFGFFFLSVVVSFLVVFRCDEGKIFVGVRLGAGSGVGRTVWFGGRGRLVYYGISSRYIEVL